MNSSKRKSYINYYWLSWILLFSLLFLAKFLQIPVIGSAPVYLVYFIYWFILMFVCWFEYSRLMNYLKNHYVQRWEELTSFSIGGKKIYGCSGFKFFRFVYSSENLGDETITYLKSNYRKFIIFIIVVFIFFPIFSIIGFTF